MRKYAGDLRVGDVWTERPMGGATRSYRVIAVAPGLAPNTMRVTGESVTTGQRRMTDFFLINRVEVHEEQLRSSRHAEASATAVDHLTAPTEAATQLAGFRAMRTNSGANWHAIPADGHPWIRAICGRGPGARSAGWTVTGSEVTCPRCQQRMDERRAKGDPARDTAGNGDSHRGRNVA
jgi:hypothetical protein